ncbi:MAG: tyrosine-type recombinase/integrase [Burkholderiaceae bacterium]
MKKDRDLPPRVFAKGKWHYLVTANGRQRVWTKLSQVRDGLPAVYSALAQLMNTDAMSGRMPGLVSAWERDVMPRHAEKTRKDEQAMGRVIADSFVEFTSIAQIEPPHVAAFLKPLRAKPRTHNGYRGHLRELMRYAIEIGLRPAGSNPVTDVPPMALKPRTRYITDSELRRIKVAAHYGDDGQRTRSGPMLCALVDMAYLTGQRIGDLLTLEWSQVKDEGILFQPAKTKASTGAAVLIEWTPKLQNVVERLKVLRKARRGFAPQLFTTQDGKAYTYWGASSAWKRAVKRAGVANVHFHDLRAKALTDVDEARGMGAARTMGAHSTETQTADYVRQKKAKRTGATR